MNIHSVIRYATLPGIILHELAHSIAIILLPNLTITKLNITQNVEYRGYNTTSKSIIISYFPFLINSAVSLYAIYLIQNINNMSSIINFILTVVLLYISIVTAFTALPSYTDVKVPIHLLREKLFTRKILDVLILFPLVLFVSLPLLLLTYLSNIFILFRIILSLFYVIIIFLFGFEIINISNISEFILYTFDL